MLFELKAPLLGFPNVTKLELTKVDDIFMRMEVPNTESPSFTLINPFILREYAFDIPDSIQNALEVTPESNILIFNTVIVTTPIENSTVNFGAPFVFNADNMTMAQVLLSEQEHYGIAEPINTFLNQE
ncbi:MAG: flagellar assembly protein FliW [Helicobacteraceae bacterium]|nr:flagellar assembly protein FliW [Helicobacteraceae bacterium]